MLEELFRKLAWWGSREKIGAIHEDDFKDVLKEFGLLESLKSGELHCSNCGVTITEDNFSYILKREDSYKLYCDKITCRQSARDRQKEA